MFWIRMTVRLLSITAAFFTAKWFSLTYGLYAYFMTSVVLDIVFFKVLRLKESNFKSQGYFKHKFQSSPGHYDRYVSAVINVKAVTFVLAHGVFFMSYFKAPIEVINYLFAICLTAIVFRYGFKFGYHSLKEVGEEESKIYNHPQPDYNGPRGNGYLNGVYTGDPNHIT